MEGAENSVSDKLQHTQVSSMIVFSVSAYTYVKTIKVTLYMFIPVPDLF